MATSELGPLPATTDVVVRYMIERNAADDPHAVAVSFEDGQRWTWAGLRDEMERGAADLLAAGLRRGDRMMLIAPNGGDYLRAWFGAAALGAAVVPVNPA